MWMEDDAPKPRPAHVIGADLSKRAVAELRELVQLLNEEIGRVEAAIVAKESSRAAADEVFKI